MEIIYANGKIEVFI